MVETKYGHHTHNEHAGFIYRPPTQKQQGQRYAPPPQTTRTQKRKGRWAQTSNWSMKAQRRTTTELRSSPPPQKRFRYQNNHHNHHHHHHSTQKYTAATSTIKEGYRYQEGEREFLELQPERTAQKGTFEPLEGFRQKTTLELVQHMDRVRETLERAYKEKKNRERDLTEHLYSESVARMLHETESCIYFLEKAEARCNSDVCKNIVLIARYAHRASHPALFFKTFKTRLQTHRPKFALLAALLTTYMTGAERYGSYLKSSLHCHQCAGTHTCNQHERTHRLNVLFAAYFRYSRVCSLHIASEHYTLNTYLYNSLLRTCLDYPTVDALNRFWAYERTMFSADNAGSNKCAPDRETYRLILKACAKSAFYTRGLEWIERFVADFPDCAHEAQAVRNQFQVSQAIRDLPEQAWFDSYHRHVAANNLSFMQRASTGFLSNDQLQQAFAYAQAAGGRM